MDDVHSSELFIVHFTDKRSARKVPGPPESNVVAQHTAACCHRGAAKLQRSVSVMRAARPLCFGTPRRCVFDGVEKTAKPDASRYNRAHYVY